MILGAIIAGGRASRFGSDKALAPWRDGRPLIAHVADALRPWTDALVVCGRAWDDLPPVADRPVPGLGPLGGIAGALAYARTHGFSGVLTAGCDMPELPGELFERLLRRAPSYCSDAPILGFWPAALAEALAARLDRGEDRSIRFWAREIGALPVPALQPLANVNTPADLLPA